MTEPVLLGLAGALRRGATNRMLIREAARLFGPATYVEADLRLPLYDGDDEAETGLPPEAALLASQIARADAVVISTPEYNKGPSGVLKNALDWVSRVKENPWKDKPVALMSAAAGRSGGEIAQTILRGFLVPFQPHVMPGPQVHVASSWGEFDADGKLKNDRYEATLRDLMQRLRAEIGR